MTTELTNYSASAQLAICQPSGENYLVQCGNNGSVEIVRDVDFGVIPKTKKPTLFKSGAEKVCMGYGLFPKYDIFSKAENFGKEPMFYYCVRCDLATIVNGTQYVITSAFGSANTGEKRNGFNSPYDAANGTLKMAQKRALVAAALSISGLSDAFTQDMENEDFMNNAKALIETDKPDSPVNTNQIKRLYAIGGSAGLNAAKVKELLAAEGITSTKQILQKDYDRICDLIKNSGKLKEDNNT